MLEQALEKGAADLGLSLTGDQQAALLAYVRLLEKWNKAYNLTAIRDVQRMVPLHLLDSLAILPLVDGDSIADIGTGAGIPGIPLAIMRPDIEFTLVDSNVKKTRFVTQAVIELGLSNVAVKHARVEQLEKGAGYSIVMARAFATLDKIVALTGHLVKGHGKILAMKSQSVNDELQALPQGWCLHKNHELSVPGVEGYRCLVDVRRDG